MTEQWNDAGYVYLIKCGKLYKIGRATDVSRRMKELTTGSAYPLQLKHSARSLSFQRLETWLHQKLKPWRARGEWFELPIDVRKWFMSKSGAQLDRLMSFDEVCDQCHASDFALCQCRNYPRPAARAPFKRQQQWARNGELLERCAHCGRWFQSRMVEIYCKECRPFGVLLDLMGCLPDDIHRVFGNPQAIDWTNYRKPLP